MHQLTTLRSLVAALIPAHGHNSRLGAGLSVIGIEIVDFGPKRIGPERARRAVGVMAMHLKCYKSIQ